MPLARFRPRQFDALKGHDRARLAGDIGAWRLSGVLFFGSTAATETLQDTLPGRVPVPDLAPLIDLDITGARVPSGLLQVGRERGVAVPWTGCAARPPDLARRSGLLADPAAERHPELPAALAAACALWQHEPA